MSQLKVLARRIASLRTASDLGKNLAKFNGVIVPAANMPAGMEVIEALSIAQILSVIQPQINLPSIIPECDCSGNGGGDGGGTVDPYVFFESIVGDTRTGLVYFTILKNGELPVSVVVTKPDNSVETFNVNTSEPQYLGTLQLGFYELEGTFDNIITDKVYCAVSTQENSYYYPVVLSSAIRSGESVTFSGTCGSKAGVIKIMLTGEYKPVGYVKKLAGETSFSFTVNLPAGSSGSLAIQYDATTLFGASAVFSV